MLNQTSPHFPIHFLKSIEVCCTPGIDSICRQVQRQLLRNESARFYHHRARKCIPSRKLQVGRDGAHCLTACFPIPPVGTVRAALHRIRLARGGHLSVHFSISPTPLNVFQWSAYAFAGYLCTSCTTSSLGSFAMYVALLGRHRARCLPVRLPMPPVRPVRETFASYGSRERDVYRKLPFRQLHGTFTVVSLRVRWLPLYRFPTLSLGAFAISPCPGVPSSPGFRLLCPV